MKLKLLLITYEFPPSGGVAVQRALSFARYLPSNGFEVHVLTARNPASPVLDQGLVTRIPREVRVHRAWTPEPSYYLRQRLWQLASRAPAGSASAPRRTDAQAGHSSGFSWRRRLTELIKRALSPDPHVLWTPFAYRRACRIIEKYDIDVVLTTAPPFSVFMVANRLARRYPRLRIVTDFRDEWRRYFLTDFEFLNSTHTRRRAAQIERETIERSDLVVAATRTSLNQIRRGHPDQPDEKFSWIPNGYEPDGFAAFRSRPQPSGKVVVTYVGTAYTICSPRYYLDALDELPEAVRSSFETRLVGRVIDEERSVVQGRKSNVRLLGFLPQSEAFKWMEDADFLLVTVTNDFAIAGKMFEYLATGKPILAISPLHGETARLIRETGAGWCVEPADRAGIKHMLQMAHDRVVKGCNDLHPNSELIKRYERPRQVAALAKMIAALCAPSACVDSSRHVIGHQGA